MDAPQNVSFPSNGGTAPGYLALPASGTGPRPDGDPGVVGPDHLLEHEAVTSTAVGAVGFCMGGGFVLSLAAQAGEKVSAAVPFYGLPGDETDDFSGLTAHVQGHDGRQDRSIPDEAVRSAFARIEEASDGPRRCTCTTPATRSSATRT